MFCESQHIFAAETIEQRRGNVSIVRKKRRKRICILHNRIILREHAEIIIQTHCGRASFKPVFFSIFSQLAETAAIWSMVYGHREFVTLIGATESATLEMLDSIKTELEVNENLAADFPEVCFPIE